MIKRINITIDEDLLNRIDSYLKNRYLTRSGLISLLLSGYLDRVEIEKRQRINVTSEEFRP